MYDIESEVINTMRDAGYMYPVWTESDGRIAVLIENGHRNNDHLKFDVWMCKNFKVLAVSKSITSRRDKDDEYYSAVRLYDIAEE